MFQTAPGMQPKGGRTAESLLPTGPWLLRDHLYSSQMPGLPKGKFGKWKSNRKKLDTTQELQAVGIIPGSRRDTW